MAHKKIKRVIEIMPKAATQAKLRMIFTKEGVTHAWLGDNRVIYDYPNQDRNEAEKTIVFNTHKIREIITLETSNDAEDRNSPDNMAFHFLMSHTNIDKPQYGIFYVGANFVMTDLTEKAKQDVEHINRAITYGKRILNMTPEERTELLWRVDPYNTEVKKMDKYGVVQALLNNVNGIIWRPEFKLEQFYNDQDGGMKVVIGKAFALGMIKNVAGMYLLDDNTRIGPTPMDVNDYLRNNADVYRSLADRVDRDQLGISVVADYTRSPDDILEEVAQDEAQKTSTMPPTYTYWDLESIAKLGGRRLLADFRKMPHQDLEALWRLLAKEFSSQKRIIPDPKPRPKKTRDELRVIAKEIGVIDYQAYQDPDILYKAIVDRLEGTDSLIPER